MPQDHLGRHTVDLQQVFIKEQELTRRLVGESMLPTLELDVSDSDVARAADRIADWLTETGGLWAKQET